MIASIRATGEIFDAAVDTVRGSLVNAIRSTGAIGVAVTGTVSDVVCGAILGTAEAGGDVGMAAKAP
jgi:hypothetical protein